MNSNTSSHRSEARDDLRAEWDERAHHCRGRPACRSARRGRQVPHGEDGYPRGTRITPS